MTFTLGQSPKCSEFHAYIHKNDQNSCIFPTELFEELVGGGAGWVGAWGVLAKHLAHTVTGSHQPSSLHGSQACYERMRHPSRSGRYSLPLWSRRLSSQPSSQGLGGSATPCLFQREKSGKILGSSIQAFAFPFHFVPLPCRCPFSFHTYSPVQGIGLAVICAIFSPRCPHGLLLPWLLYLREQAS